MIDFSQMPEGAKFSLNRKYRFALWRIWNTEIPYVMFIGLNPSNANERLNDPTIRRVMRFAKDWGYGGVVMCNLFAVVSSDPKILKSHDDPVNNNDLHVPMFGKCAGEVVFAWGNFKEARARAKVVARMFPEATALQLNKNGSPKHPLYVRADIQRIKFNNNRNYDTKRS